MSSTTFHCLTKYLEYLKTLNTDYKNNKARGLRFISFNYQQLRGKTPQRWDSSVCKFSCDCRGCWPGWTCDDRPGRCEVSPHCGSGSVSWRRTRQRNTVHIGHRRAASHPCESSGGAAGWFSGQTFYHISQPHIGMVSRLCGPARVVGVWTFC